MCSIGNVPLAAVLWNGGTSFGGVISFIFADLIVPPILDIYRRYYGWRMAGFLLASFYAALVAAGLVVEVLFGAVGLVPEQRSAKVVEASVTWNYTTILNLVFLTLAAMLVVGFLRTGGAAMLKMMGGHRPTPGPTDRCGEGRALAPDLSLTRLPLWTMLTADQRVERRGWLMAWQLQGRYFENCSCDMVCPCTTSGLTMPADYERCRVVLVFHVDSGAVEDVDVSNLTVAVLADTPPLMADGNWRVGVFMDAAASQQQAEKLGAVFAGQLGGPMAMLAPLISEMLGVQTTPIEYVEDGRRHRVRIGDEVEIEVEDFVPPQTPEGEVEKLTGMFHPANATLTIARATASRVNAFGLQFDNTGKNGHSAPFSWAA